MKKIYLAIIILFPIVLIAQNLLQNSDGNLFPQLDGTKWFGSESNRYYMIGTKNLTIKSDTSGALKLKTDGDFHNSVEFWADKGEPLVYFGVRPGDSYKLYLSGIGGFGGTPEAGRYNSDIIRITTNLFDLIANSPTQRTIETFGDIIHSGNINVPAGRFALGKGAGISTIGPNTTIETTTATAAIRSTSGQITNVAIPTLAPGKYDNELFWLYGTDATNTVVIQGEDILNGSRIRFPSGTPSVRTVALYKTYCFRWSEQANVWVMWAETTPSASGGSTVSDDVYGPAWDNVSGTAPSQNSVFDKINALELAGPVTAATNFGTNYLMVRAANTLKGIKSIDAYAFDNGTLSNMNNIYVRASASIQYPQNTMQSFNPGSTSAGINVGSYNGIPSSTANGGIWFYTAKQCLYAFYASSSSQYAISPRDELNLFLKDFKASGGPAPVFDQSEDADKWIFVDGQTSVIQTQFPIGHSWGSVANISLMFSCTNATSGNVVFALQTMASSFGVSEAVNGSGYVGAVNMSAAAVPTFAGALGVASGSIPMDGVTGPGTAVLFKLRIQRRGADAGDTVSPASDVALHAVKIDWVRAN